MIETLKLNTSKKEEMIDITSLILPCLKGIKEGLLTIFIPHTTAAITINENTDDCVQTDILRKLHELIEDNQYTHLEGNSDAHIKTLATGSSETIIIKDGRPVLGTWQGIFFCEYDGPRSRKIIVKTTEE